MRITGGLARGRAITGPEGLEARPTASKIRQAFFNILNRQIAGARFLDLCAGTGLMGMEALSRGASTLTAVEESRKLAKAVEANAKRLGFTAEVVCGDVRKVMPLLESEEFDIIFADPPYRAHLAPSILSGVSRFKLLAADGVYAIEHAREERPVEEADGLILYDVRHYGQTSVSFYRWK